MMKMSRPRTFSLTSTRISPSLKVVTRASPRGRESCSQILLTSSGLELPARIRMLLFVMAAFIAAISGEFLWSD